MKAEFDVVGLRTRRRGAELDRSLTEVREYFDRDKTFRDHGPFPALWTGGRGVAALHRALRLGSGFAPYLVDLGQFRALHDAIPKQSLATGFVSAVVLMIAVDVPGQPGRVAALEAQPFGLSPTLLDRHVITGSAQECIGQLEGYVTAGAQHIVLNPAVRPESQATQLRALRERVVPELQALRAGPRRTDDGKKPP